MSVTLLDFPADLTNSLEGLKDLPGGSFPFLIPGFPNFLSNYSAQIQLCQSYYHLYSVLRLVLGLEQN